MRTIVALSKSLSKAQADKLDAFALTFNSAMHKFYVDYIVKKIPFLELKRNYISNFKIFLTISVLVILYKKKIFIKFLIILIYFILLLILIIYLIYLLIVNFKTIFIILSRFLI